MSKNEIQIFHHTLNKMKSTLSDDELVLEFLKKRKKLRFSAQLYHHHFIFLNGSGWQFKLKKEQEKHFRQPTDLEQLLFIMLSLYFLV